MSEETIITMRGALEPVTLDETFLTLVQAMNLAKAQGQSFVVAANTDGEYVALAVDNILTMRQSGEDESEIPNTFG